MIARKVGPALAVGCGMVIAAELCKRMGRLTAEDAARLKKVVIEARLPALPPKLGVDKFMELTSPRLGERDARWLVEAILERQDVTPAELAQRWARDCLI